MPKLEKNYDQMTVQMDGQELLKLSELPKDIIGKLALYGLYVKLQRATAGLQSEEEKAEAIRKTAQALKEGKWAVAQPRKSKKDAILEEVKQTPSQVRRQFVEALRTAGVLKRLGITDEEIQKVMEA